MGLFSPKPKREAKPILKKTKKKQHGLQQKGSSSTTSDENFSPKRCVRQTKRTPPPKQKFWKLHEDLSTEMPEYVPPSDGDFPALDSGPVDPFATCSPLPKPISFRKKQTNTFQRLDSIDDTSMQELVEEARASDGYQRSSSRKKNRLPAVKERSGVRKKKTPNQKKKATPKRVLRGTKLLKVKSRDDSTSSSGGNAGYRPPTFSLDIPKTETTPKKTKPQGSSKKEFNSFMQDDIQQSFSDDTFDVRSDRAETGPTIHLTGPSDASVLTNDTALLTQSSDLHSDNGFPTSMGGQNFKQIVFDENFKTIEKVDEKKSDPGTSDFSDFVKAASQLTKTLSKRDIQATPTKTQAPSMSNSVKKKTPLKWPKLDPSRLRDTPSYCTPQRGRTTTTASSSGNLESSDWTESDQFQSGSVAPTSLPSRRTMHPSDKPPIVDENPPTWYGVSTQARHEGGASFSVVSNQSSQLRRKDFHAAIQSKSRSPVAVRSEPRRRLYRQLDGSVGGSSGMSLANASFSEANFSTSNEPVKAPARVNARESIDPFRIGSDQQKIDDNAWNANNMDHFSNLKQKDSKSITEKSSSVDDGLIQSIRMASSRDTSKGVDPETEKRDPSPKAVKISCSDTSLDYNRKIPQSYSPGPQKVPPKAVPTNAILGSMLFRQTLTTASANSSQNNSQQSNKFTLKSTSTNKNDYGPARDDGSNISRSPIPQSVVANSETDTIVSSVTEQASAFYNKNLGGRNNWSKQAQSILQNYNARKSHQHRDVNAKPSYRTYLSANEEEHVNIFRSEA